MLWPHQILKKHDVRELDARPTVPSTEARTASALGKAWLLCSSAVIFANLSEPLLQRVGLRHADALLLVRVQHPAVSGVRLPDVDVEDRPEHPGVDVRIADPRELREVLHVRRSGERAEVQ